MKKFGSIKREQADVTIVVFEDAEGERIGARFEEISSHWRHRSVCLILYECGDNWLQAAEEEIDSNQQQVWLIDLNAEDCPQIEAKAALDDLFANDQQLRDMYDAPGFSAIRENVNHDGLAIAVKAYKERIPFRYISRYAGTNPSDLDRGIPALLGYLASHGSRDAVSDDYNITKESLSRGSVDKHTRTAWNKVRSLVESGDVETLDYAVFLGPGHELNWFCETAIEKGFSIIPFERDGFTWYEVESPDGWPDFRGIAGCTNSMGLTRTALLVQRAMLLFRPMTLVGLGYSGAISGDLKVGDVIVAKSIDEYLENAKALDVKKTARCKCKCQGFRLVLGGQENQLPRGIVDRVTDISSSHSPIFKAWQAEFADRVNSAVSAVKSRDYLTDDFKLVKAPVASGSVVGASVNFIKLLKSRNRKFLAMDMETGGIAHAFQVERDNFNSADGGVLVIRGISDYADERKKPSGARNDPVLNETKLQEVATKNAVSLFLDILKTDILDRRSKV